MPDYLFLPSFVLVHLVAFMIYGNAVATKYQEIKRKQKVMSLPGIDKKKTFAKIQTLEAKIAKLKNQYPFLLLIILGIHLLSCLELPKQQEFSPYKLAFIIAGVFLAFYFVVNFLKGAGTIDKNRRYDSADYDW